MQVDCRLTVDEDNVESVLNSTNSENGNVKINDLGYEELKERTENF